MVLVLGHVVSILGDRESQIIAENNSFSEPTQNIYHVQTTTDKCSWRQKVTGIGRNFGHSCHNDLIT